MGMFYILPCGQQKYTFYILYFYSEQQSSINMQHLVCTTTLARHSIVHDY